MLDFLTNLNIPIAILAVHTLADFFCQTNWQAVNKSKRIDALASHVITYTLVFMAFGWWSGWSYEQIKWFACITFYTHFLTDYVTSRLGRRVFPWIPQTWKVTKNGTEVGVYLDYEGINGRSRNRFFNFLGVDQLIHFFTLALTYRWLIQ